MRRETYNFMGVPESLAKVPTPPRWPMKKQQRGYTFPYLYDADQSVAKAYAAACTPDFYVFDGDNQLVYRGQLDSSRPDSGIPVTGEDLRAALDAVLSGESPSAEQTPSIGLQHQMESGQRTSVLQSQGTA